MPPSQSKLTKIRDAELRRFQSNGEAHAPGRPWSLSNPRRRDTPSTVAQLACFTWQLGLFKNEALWERSHCFLPADDASGGPSKTKSRRTVFLDRRRKRNSDLTPCWLGHLELLLKAIVTSEFDADVLLDPFFIWPPVFGVELAVPLHGQPAQSDSRSSKPSLPIAPDVPPAVSPAAATATSPSRTTVGLVSTPATEI
ncbi:hypothetical protein P43SY_010391 [Pythium insidiosum]|uniref:Uncharacterized protein n=1 Tax=Pythium insidiosum TaxID=114742 RepID=A0AAD5LT95_PYTIN|nr:hypothetical protein P43SY_010391 [Pythium insidiosum]